MASQEFTEKGNVHVSVLDDAAPLLQEFYHLVHCLLLIGSTIRTRAFPSSIINEMEFLPGSLWYGPCRGLSYGVVGRGSAEEDLGLLLPSPVPAFSHTTGLQGCISH